MQVNKTCHTPQRTHTCPAGRRRRDKKIKTLQTNRTTNKIRINTAQEYDSIWLEDIQWDITLQAM
jgi:hypothetical protein